MVRGALLSAPALGKEHDTIGEAHASTTLAYRRRSCTIYGAVAYRGIILTTILVNMDIFVSIGQYNGQMEDLTKIGAGVSARRRALRLTQAALAQKAHVSRATLDALENNRLGEIGISRLSRILAVLGLELKLQDARLRRPTLDELREEDRNAQSLDRRS